MLIPSRPSFSSWRVHCSSAERSVDGSLTEARLTHDLGDSLGAPLRFLGIKQFEVCNGRQGRSAAAQRGNHRFAVTTGGYPRHRKRDSDLGST